MKDKQKQQSPAEFLKYLAENHVKITLPKDNRKYPMQHCQDDTINKDFRQLHHDIVNTIIQFCAKHNIMIDEFNLHADGLEDSIKNRKWCPSTDSCFRFENYLQKECGKPVWEMTDKEFELAKINHKPFLLSV